MRNLAAHLRRIYAALVLALTVGAVAIAQQPPESLEGKTAEQVYKNIQILKGIPANQVLPAMRIMNSSIGQDCNYCHVQDRSKDDKEALKITRRMIAMMMTLNKNSFDGHARVNCDTCHRGSVQPMTVPTLEPFAGPLVAKPQTGQAELPATLPTADQVLARYEEALGGAEALAKATTRVVQIRRIVEIGTPPAGAPSGQTDILRYSKKPDFSITANANGGCNGNTYWRYAAGSKSEIEVPRSPVAYICDKELYFYGYLPLDLSRLKAAYERVEVRSVERIDQPLMDGHREVHDTYLLIGYPRLQGDSPQWLYFDTKTGELLRRSYTEPTPLGESTFQTDFVAYGPVGDGTRMPFQFVTQTLSERVRGVYTIVQDNVSIDDSVFTVPDVPRRNGMSYQIRGVAQP